MGELDWGRIAGGFISGAATGVLQEDARVKQDIRERRKASAAKKQAIALANLNNEVAATRDAENRAHKEAMVGKRADAQVQSGKTVADYEQSIQRNWINTETKEPVTRSEAKALLDGGVKAIPKTVYDQTISDEKTKETRAHDLAKIAEQNKGKKYVADVGLKGTKYRTDATTDKSGALAALKLSGENQKKLTKFHEDMSADTMKAETRMGSAAAKLYFKAIEEGNLEVRDAIAAANLKLNTLKGTESKTTVSKKTGRKVIDPKDKIKKLMAAKGVKTKSGKTSKMPPVNEGLYQPADAPAKEGEVRSIPNATGQTVMSKYMAGGWMPLTPEEIAKLPPKGAKVDTEAQMTMLPSGYYK